MITLLPPSSPVSKFFYVTVNTLSHTYKKWKEHECPFPTKAGSRPWHRVRWKSDNPKSCPPRLSILLPSPCPDWWLPIIDKCQPLLLYAPVSRATPYPEVTVLFCRLPLLTLCSKLEAFHLWNQLRIFVRLGWKIILSLWFSRWVERDGKSILIK